MTAVKRFVGDDVVVRKDVGLLTALVEGELVALSIDQGACYGFKRVGTRIWELIAEPRSIDSLCAVLLSEFDVEEAVCRLQVLDFIEELDSEGLVMLMAE